MSGYCRVMKSKGRPKSDESREHVLEVRLNDEERSLLRSRASRAGLPVATWARQRLLSEDGPPVEEVDEELEEDRVDREPGKDEPAMVLEKGQSVGRVPIPGENVKPTGPRPAPPPAPPRAPGVVEKLGLPGPPEGRKLGQIGKSLPGAGGVR